jgi:hypothetical protein
MGNNTAIGPEDMTPQHGDRSDRAITEGVATNDVEMRRDNGAKAKVPTGDESNKKSDTLREKNKESESVNPDLTFQTQVSGGDKSKGKPDGVSASPLHGANVQGRTDEGESGGGAYPNPHTGRKPKWGGFLGHGGQTNIGYHGSGQAGRDGAPSPNSTTRGHDDYSVPGKTGGKPS